MTLKWQKLQAGEPRHDFTYATTYRTAVPGGWLVCIFYNSSHTGGPAMCFYPDPDHIWDGGSVEEVMAESSAATLR
jgi:hypothetical protein